MIQAREFPNASYDSMGQLRVGAAVSTRYGRRGRGIRYRSIDYRETAKDSIKLLAEAGVDVLVIVSDEDRER